MKRLHFKCHFLSDVILNAQTATEGTQETLDYIPGSNFLGIVAANYKDFGDELAYNIFHSGKVRFGDAHLANDNQKSFKAPLSWFINKGDNINSTKWLHHVLTDEKRNALVKSSKQIKQVRSGWLTSEGRQLTSETNFAVKSAYDRQERRNADGKIFGYKSLSAGLQWLFTVDIDDSVDEQVIIDSLCGRKSIGRSRSAQFGRIEITQVKMASEDPQNYQTEKIDDKNCIAIYAESRLAFYDEFGQPTLQPDAAQFGFDGWTIEWDLSQVANQVFAPWNGEVKGRLSDRVCFEKGSVFILSSPKNQFFEGSLNTNCVGEFKSEGFGQILVNPDFLKFDANAESTFSIVSDDSQLKLPSCSAVTEDASDAILTNWLNDRQNEMASEKTIYEKIASFCQTHESSFARITPSQWGQVRAIATTADSPEKLLNLLFNEVKASNPDGTLRSQERAQAGFLKHGKTADKWKGCASVLEDEIKATKEYGPQYTVRLAAQMAKQAKKKNEGGQK